MGVLAARKPAVLVVDFSIELLRLPDRGEQLLLERRKFVVIYHWLVVVLVIIAHAHMLIA